MIEPARPIDFLTKFRYNKNTFTMCMIVTPTEIRRYLLCEDPSMLPATQSKKHAKHSKKERGIK